MSRGKAIGLVWTHQVGIVLDAVRKQEEGQCRKSRRNDVNEDWKRICAERKGMVIGDGEAANTVKSVTHIHNTHTHTPNVIILIYNR